MIARIRHRFLRVAFKLQFAVLAILFLIIGVQTMLNLSNAKQRNEMETRENLITLYDNFNDEVQVLEEHAAALSLSFAQRPGLQERFQARDRQGMLALLEPVFVTLKTNYNIVHLQFHDPDGVVFLRIHNPEQYGEYTFTYRRANATAIIARQTVAGVEIDPDRLGIQGISPMFYQGQFIGLVEVGLDYDQALIENLKTRTGADYTMWITHKEAAPAGLGPMVGALESPSPELFYYGGTDTTPLPIATQMYDSVLENGECLTQFASGVEQERAVLVGPLLGYGDRIIGVLEISVSRAESLASLQRDQLTTLAWAGGLALLGLALMWLITNVVVLRPLGHLTTVARQQLAGDHLARVELLPGDEFGQLGHTFNVLSSQLNDTLQNQETIIARRTDELVRTNEQLGQEVGERKRAEKALHRSLDETARGQRLLLALSQAAQAVQRARTPEDVYRTVGEEIAKLGYHATIFTLTDDRAHLAAAYLTFDPSVLRAAERLTGLSARDYRFPLAPGSFYQRVIAKGEAIFTDPGAEPIAEALPRPVRSLASRLASLLGLGQAIYAPLTVGGEVHSMLTVIGANLTEADVPAVSAFASQAAIAIENARLYKQAQAHSRYLETLQRINATLRSTLPLSEVLDTVVRGTGEALDYAGTLIVTPDARGERLTLGAVWGGRFIEAAVKFTGLELGSFSLPVTAESNPMTQAYLNNQLLSWSRDPERIVAGVEPAIPRRLAPLISRAMGAELAACVPLPVGDKVVGLLVVFSPREHLPEEERASLLGMADQAGLAIQNAQLYQAAQQELVERKRAEKALRNAELEKETILDSQLEHVIYQDREHRIIWPNHAACESAGMTREKLIGRYCYEIWPACSERCEDCPVRLAMETGQQQEMEKTTPDGRSWFIRGYPVRDTGGAVVGGIEVAQEITERKRAEEERNHLLAQIQEQAQRVQQIVDTVPEGVLLLNASDQIILANPVAQQHLRTLAGVGTGEILTHLGDCPLTEFLTSPPTGLWHEVAVNRGHFQVIARSIETGPVPGGWVMVVRDVTQQREVEQHVQQQERLAAVGQLAAGIAHDFNNIMATIVLYAQLTARAEGLSIRDQERLETINQQAKHATNLIQQILDFSRRAVLERRPLDLEPLLKEQIQLLERTLPENIEIDLAYGSDEYTVNADLTSMQQIVMNLALNARDAMVEGGELRFELERIRIRDRRQAPLPDMEPGDWVRLTVSDTGTGIPSDVLPHIFDPFFTTKAPGQGSGLGLAQVYGIVGAHEGQIEVKSKPGGTTFTIYLPALPLQPLEVTPLIQPHLATGHGETILVVEDDAVARRAVAESLSLLDYQVLEATNGQEALTILELHSADDTGAVDHISLVLSDVVMPRMGGIALLHALREREIAVKVILLTGHPLEGELENLQLQEAGFHLAGWLLKPPRLEQLAESIARALRDIR